LNGNETNLSSVFWFISQVRSIVHEKLLLMVVVRNKIDRLNSQNLLSCHYKSELQSRNWVWWESSSIFEWLQCHELFCKFSWSWLFLGWEWDELAIRFFDSYHKSVLSSMRNWADRSCELNGNSTQNVRDDELDRLRLFCILAEKMFVKI
jgi:hypothetical protein